METRQFVAVDQELKFIKGIGPKKAELLHAAGLSTVMDLLYYFPRRYLNRSTITPVNRLQINTDVTIIGEVLAQDFIKTRKSGYYQVLVGDSTGHVKCVWFNNAKYLRFMFKNGDKVAMSGKVEFFNGFQLAHPDFDKLDQGEWETVNTARIIPLYNSTAELKRGGFDSRGFRKIYRILFHHYEFLLQAVIPENISQQFKLMERTEALRQIHYPDSNEKFEAAKRYLKFEELFFLQLALCLKGSSIKATPKLVHYSKAGEKIGQIYEKLPFELTEAQKKVVKEIWTDMKSPVVMNRLLQGDVGSGKTVVALLCASMAIGNGFQAALMAPTEILAEQHFRSLQKLAKPAGIQVSLLIGGQRRQDREQILSQIEAGQAELVVGTHALIQENVSFKNLALVIIDEQHRFGVMQRGDLIKKGLNPDVLVMTATPIPRTMSMTIYGDMNVSVLDQVPARRGKVITKIVEPAQLRTVYQYTKEQIKAGSQAYIVYPLIEESEKMDLEAAISSYEYLAGKVFPELRLALLHGAMKSQDKESVMLAFSRGEIDILVSTTVIEVGVDNPNASVMIIENAERFGLTQIHQLRGRIGRGDKNGVCVLVERKRSDNSHQRLNIIRSTTNGFEISEQDLKLRGPGEFYSTRQHGFPKMKIADLLQDQNMMQQARKTVKIILADDPHLRQPGHEALRRHFIQNYAEFLEFISVL